MRKLFMGMKLILWQLAPLEIDSAEIYRSYFPKALRVNHELMPADFLFFWIRLFYTLRVNRVEVS